MVKEEIKMENKETKEDLRRNFIGPDGETVYYINVPTAEDIRGADWIYSKTYTKSLVEGITTSAEMMDILRRRGIIGPEFEERSAELSNVLNEKILALENADSLEEKRELAVEVARAREELFTWNQRLNGPMNNTCEQIADDARLEYLTSAMIEKDNEDKDGSRRVWDSYDSFLMEKNTQLASRSRFEVMIYLQGLDSDFLEKTPEALALKEIEDDVMSKAEEVVRAAQAMEEEEKFVEEIEAKEEGKEDKEEKPKKKKGSRKKTTKPKK
jgi:hypothetical protein